MPVSFIPNILLGSLPFCCLVLTILCLQRSATYSFDALIRGSLVWGLVLAVVTNLLSAFSLLFFVPIFLFWISYVVIATGYLYKNGMSCIQSFRVDALLCILFAIAVMTFVVAVMYPTNNWDSMTYHMPKIMHWLQNQNMAHYITNNLRQTGLAPFAEMIIFHTYALSGGDYLANLLQWLAFIGGMCVAFSTASLLGASRRGQLLAALFWATLPMGIAQATSTQTDNAVMFWLCCVANRFLVWRQSSDRGNALFFGIAVGLSILTKGTANLICLPFVAAFAFYSIKSFRKLFVNAVLAGLLATSIFSPHLFKNYVAYQDIFAGSLSTVVKSPGPSTLVANILANILSNDPGFFGKEKIDNMYESLLEILHINKKDFFQYGPISGRAGYSTHEDVAQNPLHTLLLILSLLGTGASCYRASKNYCYYVCASIILFCLMIGWQPWITRLQVPLFALAAPLVGIYFDGFRSTMLKKMLVVTLVMSAIPSLFFNATRPLFAVKNQYISSKSKHFLQNNREALYFTNKKDLRELYLAAVEALAQAKPATIGLWGGVDSWEYPLWALLRSRLPYIPTIKYLDPTMLPDVSASVSSPMHPDFLFILESSLPGETSRDIKLAPLRLYKKTNTGYKIVKLHDMTSWPRNLSPSLMNATGFSFMENWGVWAEQDIVEMELDAPIDAPFRITLNVVHVFATNTQEPLRIRAGSEEHTVNIPAAGVYSVTFNPSDPVTSLVLEIPGATKSPCDLGISKDNRKLGVGISSIVISTRD